MTVPLSEGLRHRFPNRESTWAGECPWTGNYCVGTESGEVLFYKDDGDGPMIERREILAEEAINGVAFHEDLIGVSTRSEVNLHRLLPGDRGFELVAAGPGGAHGISATPKGLFVAPMGPAGLFCINAGSVSPPIAWFEHAGDAALNYYALTNLSRSGSKDVFACAARTDGLLTIQIEQDGPPNPIARLTSANVDLIGVCSIRTPEWPFAVAALCLDRSLIFVRNVLSEEQPRTLRFDDFRGTPYTILSADGHLIVLTNREIVVLPNLASRYLNEEKLDSPIHYRKRPVHAVDAFITYGKDLMILTDEGVDLFEISMLLRGDCEQESARESPGPQNWDGVMAIPAPVTISWDHLVA
jgi:hypothetical protein